jgi:DNA-binding CsgD family transcriptional regulator
MTLQAATHGGTEEAHRRDIRLLLSREREFLTLFRKHQRFQSWLAVTSGLAALAVGAADTNEVLRRVSEALKTKLAFQRVLAFERDGASLRPLAFEPPGPVLATIGETCGTLLRASKDGRSDDGSAALKQALGLERFLWHWGTTARAEVLVLAGYDRERAPFYPAFDETDTVQFALLGAQLDRILAGVGASARVNLSTREVDVSRWLARGKSNKEIATILGISPRTVQIHIAHLFDKVGVRTRAGLASWVVEARVVG